MQHQSFLRRRTMGHFWTDAYESIWAIRYGMLYQIVRPCQYLGITHVKWPNEHRAEQSFNQSPNRSMSKLGFVYIILSCEDGVRALLRQSRQVKETFQFYYPLSSKRMRSKDVEVIPWYSDDAMWKMSHIMDLRLDTRKTVFVGALHGMMNAEMLAELMQVISRN